MPGADEMLSLVNQVRENGTYCGDEYYPPAAKLKWEDRLAEAARDHGQDMAEQGYFDHTGLDGSSVGDRVTRQGYRWSSVGENIAQGQTSLKSVMADWVDSAGHCRNLMSDNFRQLGAYRAGNVWVQVFAKPAGG
jgi:uncharacterized protein YkwD